MISFLKVVMGVFLMNIDKQIKPHLCEMDLDGKVFLVEPIEKKVVIPRSKEALIIVERVAAIQGDPNKKDFSGLKQGIERSLKEMTRLTNSIVDQINLDQFMELREKAYGEIYRRHALEINPSSKNYFFVTYDGNTIGYFMTQTVSRDHNGSNIKAINIPEIFLKEEYRNKGAGALLIRQIEKIARGNKYPMLDIRIDTDHKKALKFARIQGFRPAGNCNYDAHRNPIDEMYRKRLV